MQISPRNERALHGTCAMFLTGAVLALATPVPAQDVSSQTLVYATYDGQNTAGEVFKTIRANQNATGERIHSYAVVSKDLKGKVSVRDQRHMGTGVGAVIGAVIGLVGGPAGAVAGAAVGGAAGYLTGDAVGIPREKVDEMKAALKPDSSALVVVLDDRWVKDLDKGLREANARLVVAAQIASGVTKTATPAPASTPASK